MATKYGMKLSLFFLCVSAGQSFLTSRAVDFSRRVSPGMKRLLTTSGWKSFSSTSFLGPNHKLSTSRFANALATAAENTTSKVDTSFETEVVVDSEAFLKPDRDLHEYRYIRLKNNLKVLLVSTEKSSSGEKSAKVEAASVHVQAGHFDDTIPGLAHFHEHMLFLGTEKYPDEDDYEAFLSKFGGSANAYTDMEDTNYYFSVTTQKSDDDEVSEGLRGGLDRLAQFFVAPIFEESMVERELRAIDSEYRNGKTSDAWRNFQFLKAVSNPKHPFSNFGCGNYETLMSQGSPPIQALKAFWKEYYKTSNIRLSVVGSSSLDALQRVVEDSFGELPISNEPPRRKKVNPNSLIFPLENAVYNPQEPAFGKEQLGKIREVIPILESRLLKVQFATPPMEDPVLRKTKPHRVVSHLLGHESPGSLHCLMNEMGLITGLTSGASIDTSEFSLFGMTLSLTPKGMKEKELVLDLVFQWIGLIKDTAIKEPDLLAAYHNELSQISANGFKFRENGDPTDFCSSASELLFDDDHPAEILASGSLVDDYDPVVAKSFLERLSPDNAMVTLVDSSTKPDESDGWKVEPLYGANYREQNMSDEQLRQWGSSDGKFNPKLHLPALNEYIPSDFSLRCDDTEEGRKMSNSERDEYRKEDPILLKQGPNFRLWHKMDRFWRVPKAFIRLSIVSPNTYCSPRSMTLSRIYQRVLNDDLNSFVYDASLAGCNYRVSAVPSGYKLSVSGYSEKLPFLMETLTSRMLSLIEEMREGREAHPALFDKFQKAKENLLRETKNYRLDTPYEVANYNSRLLLEEHVWYLDDYIDEMEGENAERNPLTMEECADVARECLTGRLKINSLCMGNIDEKSAEEVSDVVTQHFLKPSRPLCASDTPSSKSLKLPTREEAVCIFGSELSGELVPIKFQELAHSSSEENNAVEMTFQAGSDLSLGFEGVGILDLISHMAYNSAYNQLRTKEQLGYIVSAFTRRTAGSSWGLSVVVQSSSASPKTLEERIEAWMKAFRKELEEMPAEMIAMEANGMVGQLLEEDTKLAQEVGAAWGEIAATETCHEKMATPEFDRVQKLADELMVSTNEGAEKTVNGNIRKTPDALKRRVLEFFDRFYAADASERRVLSSRVYNHASKAEYESSLTDPGVMSSYSDIRYLKEFMSSWPNAPYWRVSGSKAP